MIPTYQQWMRDTKAALKRRSSELVALDKALKVYDQNKSPSSRDALKNALFNWKRVQGEKGSDWRKSVRNQKGIVTKLDRELDDTFDQDLRPEEVEALAYVAAMQADALTSTFRGKSIQFKSHTLMGIKSGIQANWATFKAGAGSAISVGMKGKSIYGAAKKINKVQGIGVAGSAAMETKKLKDSLTDLCKTLCPGKDPNEVFQALGLPRVEQFAAELAPFVGALTAGVGAVVEWIKVIKLQFQQGNIQKTRYAFAPGDPEAALDAVIVLLDREITSGVAKAGVKTGAFGGKLAGAFADAGTLTGPVIGMVQILADIMQTIIEYMRDIKEVDQANELISRGALSLELFEVCPILGCYFLVVQDHSTIINFAVGEYGSKNFVFDAERLIEKVDVVLDKSRAYIHASRFEMAGMSTAKGVVKQNMLMKGKLGSHVAKGQVAPTGVRIQNKKDDVVMGMKNKVAEWRKKPIKKRKVKPSDIVGMGHLPGGGMGIK